jgi:hypothetical protein
MSSLGFYCLSQVPFETGACLTCWLEISTAVPSNERASFGLHCLVRVVRVEDKKDGTFGIACKIENFRTGLADAVGPDKSLPFGLGKTLGRKQSLRPN